MSVPVGMLAGVPVQLVRYAERFDRKRVFAHILEETALLEWYTGVK
jgi:hypothetical protein